MKTPIYDFVKSYAEEGYARFHMPGHKGISKLGCEAYDITEIDGADILYDANGIIAESEQNATELFATAHTYYSAEGSSLAIKAMLALIGRSSRILAARNAHKAFVYAAALLDLSVSWLDIPSEHLCTSAVSAHDIEAALDKNEFDAVYVTSPDYLGHLLDIGSIAAVCKAHGTPLLVDNAHGAYLAFTKPSLHPIALGATMCTDSAHKTLPTLTGGAYLHIAKDASQKYTDGARRMLSLFASTSPSYLILASLDLTNAYLAQEMPQKLPHAIDRTEHLKLSLSQKGYRTEASEPLKLVLDATSFGYTGTEISSALQKNGVFAEYADDRYTVFMISTETSDEDFDRLETAILSLPIREALPSLPFSIPPIRTVLSLREAILSPCERIRTSDATGRICATPCVSCPPAIPIVMSGERITKEHISLLIRYGTNEIDVIKE